MENNDKILHENLKKQIYKQLDKVGIAHELVDIKFTKDSELVLSGELYSEQVHQTIVQIVMDITGEENIIDRLIVIAGLYDDQNDDDNDGFYNEDQEFDGTEDIYRSIEDGIPYIPPTRPLQYDPPKDLKWKKRPKKIR